MKATKRNSYPDLRRRSVEKRKKKGKTTPQSGPGFIKRFWLPLCLAMLALFMVLGTWGMMERSRCNAVRDRLPKVLDLSTKTEEFRQEVERANKEIRRVLDAGGLGQELGYKIGQLGKLYQANHYWDQAVLCYRLAMELEPENPEWPYFLAFINQERGEGESVLELLERTIELAPDYSPAILKLADIHFKTGKTDKAKAYYKRRLDFLKNDPYALLGLARIALDASQWEIARAHLNKAIESNPKFGNAHRLLASVHEHYSKIDEMQQALDRAAQCTRFHPAPDPWIEALNDLCYDVEQLLVLGSKAVTELDIEKASMFFGRAKDLDQENPKAHLALGRLCFMVGQRKQARWFFEKAIDLDRKSDEAYFQLGIILRGEGKLKEAKQMFLRALDFHPDNPNVYNNLGVTLLEQRRFEEAVKHLRQALEIYPEHINARYNLGMALWGSGKIEEALTQYYQVLQLKPEWSTAANSLAWILATDKNESIRNGNEAVRWALVACQGEARKNPDYLDTLAAAYAEASHFKKALQISQECLNLARETRDISLVKEVERRIQLYKSGKTFHE